MRALDRLNVRAVAALKKPGRHADGGNLYLKISGAGTSLSKRWTFMYVIDGRQREAGLGSVASVSLAEARRRAAEWRSLISSGVDPLDAKRTSKSATVARKRKTFGQCAEELVKAKRSEWRNAKHAGQWADTLAKYCTPIRDVPIDEIKTEDILAVLQPLWKRIPETAARLRGRVEAVLDYAKAHGLRSGENPAAWRGHLALILPKRPKLARGHFAAMSYPDISSFLARLREHKSAPALALEFLVLVAGRSGEVLGARWDEIDFATKTWTIAAHRMKAAREHRIPLSGRAVEILEKLAKAKMGSFVFPGQRRNKPLSPSSMAAVLRQMKIKGATIHGMRSAFRDWAGNETSFPRELAEQALAHSIGDQTEQAYRRSDALERRRQLMMAWGEFCAATPGSNVIPIMARK